MLYDCSELTERELDSIKQEPRPSLTRQEAAFVWDKIPGEETKTGILIDFLKRTFGVDWIEPENVKKQKVTFQPESDLQDLAQDKKFRQ